MQSNQYFLANQAVIQLRASRQAAVIFFLALATSCAAGDHSLDERVGSVQQRTISGDDDRTDVYDHNAQMWRDIATNSTAMFVHAGDFDFSNPSEVGYSNQTLGERYNLCSSERFWFQPAFSGCSASLIGDDLVLTAGHCITEAWSCDAIAVVFNYQMQSESNWPTLTSDDFYRCSEVIVDRFDHNQEIDYAIFRLDRPVADPLSAVPVAGAVSRVTVGQPLVSVGHPLGLPTKIVEGVANETGVASGYASYHTTIDLQGGSSGSPVFDDSGVIVGIMTAQAGRDFQDNSAACNTYYEVSEGGNAGYVRYAHFAIRHYCSVTGEEGDLCGSLTPQCGDGICDPHERDATCPTDCDGVQPPEWICSSARYLDSACECDCGAPDPGCDNPGTLAIGCDFNQVCGAEGGCSTTHSVPGRIEAEKFADYEDQTSTHFGDCNAGHPVDMQFTGDTDGSRCNVGWTTPGEWLEYAIDVETAGEYSIALRLASRHAGQSVRVEVDGDVVGSVSVPANGWQSYSTTAVGNIELGAGDHTVRVVFETGGVNLTYLQLDLETPLAECLGDSDCEFNEICSDEGECSTTHSAPGRIEAEKFGDYNEQTASSSGNCNTGHPVDMQFTDDPDGSRCNVGWTSPGEWLQYDVDVTSSGSYAVFLRLASAQSGQTVRLEVNGVEVGSADVPNNGWQSFSSVHVADIPLTAGPHTFRVVFETGNVNLNYLLVESTCDPALLTDELCDCECGTADPACSDPQALVAGCEFNEVCGLDGGCSTAHAVPGRIEAEKFSSYEEQTTTHFGDCNAGHPVDMQTTGDPDGSRCNIAWTSPGEWLEYELEVVDSGEFAVSLRLATARSNKSVQVEVDGQSIGSVVVPNNGWQSYNTLFIGDVSLATGSHTLRVLFEDGDANLTYIQVTN